MRTCAPLPAALIAAQKALWELEDAGAGPRVLAAGKNIIEAVKEGRTPSKADEDILLDYSRRSRQGQSRYGR